MRGGLAELGVARDLGLVEQLPRAQGGQFHQPAEVQQRLDLRDLAQVAFEIGGDIAVPPAGPRLRRLQSHQRRHQAAQEQRERVRRRARLPAVSRPVAVQRALEQIGGRHAVDLSQRHRVQHKVAGSAGQAFADPLH